LTEGAVTRAEFNDMKDTVKEIKDDAKAKAKSDTREMLDMRDSKVRTEVKLESIISAQERSNIRQEKSDIRQEEIFDIVQAVQNKPFIQWSKITTAWKIAIGVSVIGTVVPWVLGNYMTFTKILK